MRRAEWVILDGFSDTCGPADGSTDGSACVVFCPYKYPQPLDGPNSKYGHGTNSAWTSAKFRHPRSRKRPTAIQARMWHI